MKNNCQLTKLNKIKKTGLLLGKSVFLHLSLIFKKNYPVVKNKKISVCLFNMLDLKSHPTP